MKIKNLIAGLFLSSIMGVGVVTGITLNSESNVKEAYAAKVVYCKVDKSWWTADGAAVGVHYWGGSSGTQWPGAKMSLAPGETTVWTYTIPDGHTNCIFTRLNPNGSYWDAKTGDLTIPTDGKNLYTITSSSGTWDPSTVTGSWSTYVPPVTPLSAPVITKSGDSITWSAVANAVGYKVYVDGNEYADLASSATSYTFESHKTGSHTIQLKAKGNGTTYSDSSLSNSVSITVAEGYYLVGSFNSWNTTGDSGEIKATTSSGVHTVSITTTKVDTKVKLVKFGSNMNITWYSSIDGDSEFAYPVSVDGDANIVLGTIGTYTIQVSGCNDSAQNATYTVTSTPFVSPYTVTIGSTTANLISVKKDNNEQQYKAHFDSISSKQSIVFKNNGTAFSATAEANDSDNADSFNNIVLQDASNVDVYLKYKNSAWTYYVGGRTAEFFISVWPEFYVMIDNTQAAQGNYMYTGLDLSAGTELKLFCASYFAPSGDDFDQEAGLGFTSNGTVITCSKTGRYNFYVDNTGSSAKLYIGGQSQADIIASKFADDFLDAFENGDGHSGICKSDGSTSTALISSTWTTLNTNYTTNVNPNTDAKNILKNADPLASTLYGKFAALYDKIYRDYGDRLSLTNYAGRSVQAASNGRMIQPILNETNTAGIAVVIVVSVISLSTIGGYFYLRKRKED